MIEDEQLNQPPNSIQQQIEKLQADKEAQKQRTWSYYQKIRKEDPHRFLQPKIQVQMMKDAADLGQTFRDGDYNAI